MSFANTLTETCIKARMTRYRLPQEARVNPSHVTQLERGERLCPSHDLVLRIGQALLDYSGEISLKDVNRLLKAAGYGPLPRE